MLIADLHIHSKYSRATSRDCGLPQMEQWARYKGIGLLGTGDFTHPLWRQELQQLLEPAEEGLYRLRSAVQLPAEVAGSMQTPRFVISGEISCIYRKNGRTRKIHNVILLPSLEHAQRLSQKLEALGCNLHSDGRPILGLDAHHLLQLTLEVCPEAIFIPAHIWTPHFSLLGAFSGFDSMEACFEDLTPYIHALETGLSSDPLMNRRVSGLDRFLLISNSDAHSPAKLGREATLLDIPLCYNGLAKALSGADAAGLSGTIEFFPEEGKYHLDGHRNCGLCLTPTETVRLGGRCPVCGKKLTVGVLHRVEQLSDRVENTVSDGRTCQYLMPLPEVLAACMGFSAAGKRVMLQYHALLRQLGPEFTILRETPLAEIEAAAGSAAAEGLRRLRAGQIQRIPGYDGKYGVISLLTPEELQRFDGR